MRYLTLALLAALTAPALAADFSFQGTYETRFKNDRPNAVEGTATKTGDNTYDAVFTTNWKGKIETYKGTITGDFAKGDLKGDFFMQQNGKNGRHFIFNATADNYVVKGKTFEIKGANQDPTGTLTFKKVDTK